MIITGRVWKFGDDINTDLIFPHEAFRVSPEEQLKLVFSTNRPGWSGEVKSGDIIVAAKNFGTGSSRPGALLLKRLGLGGLIADSINGLFFRNCVSYGFPALIAEGVHELFDEGDVAEFDLKSGLVKNLTSGVNVSGTPVSENMIETISSGGIEALLIAKGYMSAK